MPKEGEEDGKEKGRKKRNNERGRGLEEQGSTVDGQNDAPVGEVVGEGFTLVLRQAGPPPRPPDPMLEEEGYCGERTKWLHHAQTDVAHIQH